MTAEGVPRRIVGFHQDEERHWVADLECGHGQHVRHDPPWQVRSWVTTPEGRSSYLGTTLHCRRCLESQTTREIAIMSQPEERLRPHPSTRLAGPVVPLQLPDLARALFAEPHPAKSGHRQAGLIHRGPLRVLLFAFEAGGRLPEHRAPGHVVIHCLRGDLTVEAAGEEHRLAEGHAVVLDPDIPQSVAALAESEMLLTVCMG